MSIRYTCIIYENDEKKEILIIEPEDDTENSIRREVARHYIFTDKGLEYCLLPGRLYEFKAYIVDTDKTYSVAVDGRKYRH